MGLSQNFAIWVKHQNRVATVFKKGLETIISNKHAQNFELNDIDIKTTKKLQKIGYSGYGITMC